MATTIDLATYAYNLELNDKGFTSGMLGAENTVGKLTGKMGSFSTFLKGAVIGGIAAVGVALVGMGVKGVKSADELQQALNNLQAQTGATAEETKGFEESLTNIYAKNLGESFDDIAQSMATVKQTLNLTGQELENTTQIALMMRDTFGYDVTESINTVNGLMANFGITAEQAYNLMAQGAQNGADKNGDMLDTLNEYGTHFAQLGISAEEFTDTLIQGASSGAFQIDKIGDAVKEFSIRSKDMSKTSAEGFKLLGLNADEMFNTFAQGGEGAELAFQDVVKRLLEMDDPLAQNTAGVALFGTQFEDLGIKGIQALSDIGDQASLSKDALGQIANVRYDSVGQALEGIKRGLETSFLIPIGQQILPVLSNLANWIQTNMPQIQETTSGAFGIIGDLLSAVGGLIGGLIGLLQDFYNSNKIVFDGIALVIQIALNVIISALKMTTSLLKGDWSAFGTEFLNLTNNIWNLVKNAFSNELNAIKTNLDNSISGFKASGNSIMNGIYDSFKSVWSTIVNWFTSSVSNIISKIGGYSGGFYNSGYYLFNSFWDGIKSIWYNISSWVSDKVNWISNKLSTWRSAINTMSSGSDYPAYATGTTYVPYTGLALIHQGEAIIPAQHNPYNPENRSKSSAATSPVINNYATFNVNARNGLSEREMRQAADYLYDAINKRLMGIGP
ncbi:MAG: phage tail tape measure protein [Syntrophomonadaceae bacterium]|nr:phage tail tape measure protein [Syntrophomonadaceae bacterium]